MENFDLSQLPPEVIAELVALGTIGDEQAELSRQMEIAQALKHREGPQGIHTGRTYVAASPLSHIARGVEGYRAGKELEDLEEQRQELFGKQRSGRERFLDLLRGPKPDPGPMGPPAPSAPRGPMGPPALPKNEVVQRTVPTPTPDIQVPPPSVPSVPRGSNIPMAGAPTEPKMTGTNLTFEQAMDIARQLRNY